MSMVDLKCQDSINSSDSCCLKEKQGTSLLLSDDHQIYLFFDLPLYLYSFKIKEARLLLFKLLPHCYPEQSGCCGDNQYNLYPLIDFYTINSCAYGPPALDYCQKVTFYNNYNLCYTEIDITHIVNDWVTSKLENKGLLLTGNECSQEVYYASGSYPIIGMRPTLRINCEGIVFCQTLSSASCDVVVN